jgi:cell division control protein 11
MTEIRPDLYLHLSSHLADLKSLTHDVLYETYRTEKLSRTVHTDVQYVTLSDFLFRIAGLNLPHSDTSILPEELATQSVCLEH